MSKPHVNLAVIGHLDCGKSTLAGHLLYKVGAITKKDIDKNEKEATFVNKKSFKYAWVMDKLPTERQRGNTIDMHVAHFETPKFEVTVTDCPGHRDYTKNAITGSAYSDCVVLVVDASPDNFEAGIAKDGQTREHAQLAYTLGVRQAVVAVTKMDLAGYAPARFEAISKEIQAILKKIGFNTDKVPIVPVCGWTGDNLLERARGFTQLAWFEGPTLMEAVDSAVEPPKRVVDKPLRMPVQDVYKLGGGVGPVVCGRVEVGCLKPGQKVVFVPSGQTAEVKQVERNRKALGAEGASAGLNVGFSIKAPAQLSKQPRRGDVVCDAAEPVQEAASFQAQVFITHPGPEGISAGYTPMLDVHTAHVACRFQNLVSKLDRKTGKEVEKDPKALRNGDVAIVDFVPTARLVVEPFADYPSLGRFALRDGRQVVGFGIIKAVTRRQPATKALQAAAPKKA